MSTLMTIVEKMRHDRIQNSDIRWQCQIKDIVKFVKRQKREWSDHANRASDK